MYIGEVSTTQLISVALMLLFAFTAIFFIGYKYAYDKAISHANEQIEKITDELRIKQGLGIGIPDMILGNIEIPNFGGQNEE